MKFEVKVPEVGESITEGVIVAWFKQSGETVKKDEPIFELETDKITMQVLAEESGVLSIGVASGDVEVGQIVGSIDTEAEAGAVAPEPAAAPAAPEPAAAPAKPAEPTPPEAAPAAKPEGEAKPLSPAARRMVEEHDVDPATIEGSGKDGRVTKGDVIEHLDRKATAPEAAPQEAPPAPAEPVEEQRGEALAQTVPGSAPSAPPPATKPPSASTATRGERETRQPMSSLRKRLAQRLVDVQQNAAILTTFNEVDMSAVMAMRKRFQERFVARHGNKLGFMSFFVKAVVDALKQVPAVNARIEGDEIVHNHYYDIGIAVGTDKGLVVPVLRDVDAAGFAEIEQRIADYGKRARERRLELAELTGGVFTISNGGVYGSLVSTPILNPPQSAILGMHGIKKRPMVVGDDDRIEARPMMYLALSYDHRLIDGLEAVTFLKHIVEVLEQPERLLFDI
jgi:2-oxoglutarate dehydrogenase E2 component (dihydrolipoamide succinyltransferase)